MARRLANYRPESRSAVRNSQPMPSGEHCEVPGFVIQCHTLLTLPISSGTNGISPISLDTMSLLKKLRTSAIAGRFS